MSVKILLIEDEPSVANVIIKMLDHALYSKFDVDHVLTMEDGKNSVKNNKYACILLDLYLPNSAGAETFERCRKECPCYPIVIISGHEEDGIACVRAGAQDFIPKTELSSHLLERSINYAIERTKSEIEKWGSEKRFKLLSEANFEGIAITKKGKFIDVNKQFAEMIGCSVDELIGDEVMKFVHLKDREMVKYNMSINYEMPYEHIAIRKNGESFPAEIHARTIEDNGLRLTAIRDMTRYHEAQNALTKSEKKYKELIEASKASIFEVDLVNDRFIYVNDYLCKQTLYSREELLNIGPTSIMTEKSLKSFIDRIKALDDGEIVPSEYEYSAKRKDGEIIWVLTSTIYKKDVDGNIIGGEVIAIDITDRKRAEEEARHKEDLIFTQLIYRIQKWRTEIVSERTKQVRKLSSIDSQISHLVDSLGINI